MTAIFKDFKDNDDAVLYGLLLFLIIVIIAVACYAITGPIIESGEAAFGGDYSDQYVSSQYMDSIGFIKLMVLGGGAMIFIVIIAAVMVLNRAIIRRNDT